MRLFHGLEHKDNKSDQESRRFEGNIYSSSDLKEWTRLARFITPAVAYSFERLNDVFYVGLASYRQDANPASGKILQVVP